MRILGIGVAALDVIQRVASYPPEDTEVRALDQRLARGGNAATTLVVLSQLGHACAWAGVLAHDPSSRIILDDLQHWGVDTGLCRRVPGGATPTSYITVSEASGSRTIVHYRELPEFDAQDFADLDLGGLDWVHFEGRPNVDEMGTMLARLRHECPELRCSLEVEKPRTGIEGLIDSPNLLLFSRGYAESRGHSDPARFLESVRPITRADWIVCAWGSDGAYAMDRGGRATHSPAFAPPRLVETVGAGDVLNAGMIHSALLGKALPQALEDACRLAGRKCGRLGFAGLGDPRG